MLYSHDPLGDTLYGVDVTVHPRHRGRGIARELYAARKELCQRQNLRRLVLEGRIPGSQAAAQSGLTAEEYARRVEAEERQDSGLSLQLQEGFVLRKVMSHYVRDPAWPNHATFLEWLNPAYEARPARGRSVMRKVRSFEHFARPVAHLAQVAAGYG